MNSNLEDSSKEINKQTSKKSYQFIYISLIISPIIYFLILLVLQIKVLDEINIPPSFFNNSILNLVLFVIILHSIAVIIFTYKIVIPLALKEKTIEYRFNKNVLVLIFGVIAIATDGLILGVLWLNFYNIVPFFIVLPFMGFGIIHGYYLYSKYMLHDYARKEYLNKRSSSTDNIPIGTEMIDTSLEIFKNILGYLNSNEKILLYYKPRYKKFLKTRIVGSIIAGVFFFIIGSFSPNLFSLLNIKFIISYLFFGFGCFSFTALPLIIFLKAKNFKNTLFVFTSQKIIAKYPKEIKIITYNQVISSKISRISSNNIEILFVETQDDRTKKNEKIYIQMVPRKLNLLNKIMILIEKYSNKEKEYK